MHFLFSIRKEIKISGYRAGAPFPYFIVSLHLQQKSCLDTILLKFYEETFSCRVQDLRRREGVGKGSNNMEYLEHPDGCKTRYGIVVTMVANLLNHNIVI